MPKAPKLAAVFLLCSIAASCNEYDNRQGPITEKEWDAFDAAIDREDWTAVEKAASVYLARFKGDERPPAGYFRLMLIESWATQASNDQLPIEELRKRLESFTGKPITTGDSPISFAPKVPFGCITTPKESDLLAVLAFINKDATPIHCYIEGELNHPLDTKKLEGKHGALRGKLSSFKCGFQDPTLCIVTLHLKDASIITRPHEAK